MKNIWQTLPEKFEVLAPMEDVTDTVFRQLIAEVGKPDLFFTEFTSVDGMFSPGGERVRERLEYTAKETPLIAQIWGKNPENYQKAAKELAELGFAGIDINMGCPVPKITGKGCCSALIDNQALAEEIIDASRAGAGSTPVSVKTRIGFKKIQTEEWLSFLLGLKLPAITLHGRVASQQSKKPANWSEVGKAVKLRNKLAPETLIIGNGDLFSRADIEQRFAESGVDGVMIARGIFADPLIFNRGEHKSIRDRTAEEKINYLLRHLELFSARWGQAHYRYAAMKRFYKIYINGFPNAQELRIALMETKASEAAIALLKNYQPTPPRASKST